MNLKNRGTLFSFSFCWVIILSKVFTNYFLQLLIPVLTFLNLASDKCPPHNKKMTMSTKSENVKVPEQ